MRFESSGVTGGIVEEELFGKSDYEDKEKLEFEEYKYFTRKIAFRVLKEMQPFEPTDPEPDFANTVHYYVYEGLGLDASQVKFFTAVKSPLDKFHKIDGWFELDDGQTVTIDLTKNPNKDEYRADIVFIVPAGGLDRKVDKEQFITYSKELSNQVLSRFRSKK